jgi:hypothetical protein
MSKLSLGCQKLAGAKSSFLLRDYTLHSRLSSDVQSRSSALVVNYVVDSNFPNWFPIDLLRAVVQEAVGAQTVQLLQRL